MALAALAGCIQGASSTPPPAPTVPGADVRVAFSWVINGQDPTTTDACGDGAVEFIRMTVLDGATGTQTVTTLNWACSLGRWRSPAAAASRLGTTACTGRPSHEGRALSVAPGHADPATHAVTPSPEPVTLLAGETHDFDATNTTVTGQPGHPVRPTSPRRRRRSKSACGTPGPALPRRAPPAPSSGSRPSTGA